MAAVDVFPTKAVLDLYPQVINWKGFLSPLHSRDLRPWA